jgi:quercetin dioxygenase-like cupin family protein
VKKRAILPVVCGTLLTTIAATFATISQSLSSTVPTVPTKIVTILKSSVNDAGQAIRYPQGGVPEVTMLRVEIPPGRETGWHTHPVPSFAYVISGTLTVALKNGRQLRFTASQGLAESVDVLHDGKNLGATPVELVVVYLGEKSHPIVVRP